jgi:hypothetical protein
VVVRRTKPLSDITIQEVASCQQQRCRYFDLLRQSGRVFGQPALTLIVFNRGGCGGRSMTCLVVVTPHQPPSTLTLCTDITRLSVFVQPLRMLIHHASRQPPGLRVTSLLAGYIGRRSEVGASAVRQAVLVRPASDAATQG